MAEAANVYSLSDENATINVVDYDGLTRASGGEVHASVLACAGHMQNAMFDALTFAKRSDVAACRATDSMSQLHGHPFFMNTWDSTQEAIVIESAPTAT